MLNSYGKWKLAPLLNLDNFPVYAWASYCYVNLTSCVFADNINYLTYDYIFPFHILLKKENLMEL